MPFYMMKIGDCSWEKDFIWIIKGIKHLNYPNLYLFLKTNGSNMTVAQVAKKEWSFPCSFLGKRKKVPCTAQKMRFSIEDFFSKCDQIHSIFLCSADLGKDALILFMFELKFPYKMRPYEYLGKISEMFPYEASLSCVTDEMCLLKCLYSRKPPLH